jgi:hypothetical protein
MIYYYRGAMYPVMISPISKLRIVPSRGIHQFVSEPPRIPQVKVRVSIQTVSCPHLIKLVP